MCSQCCMAAPGLLLLLMVAGRCEASANLSKYRRWPTPRTDTFREPAHTYTHRRVLKHHCLLVPTYIRHFAYAAVMLQLLEEAAQDRVQVYMLVDREREIRIFQKVWRRYGLGLADFTKVFSLEAGLQEYGLANWEAFLKEELFATVFKEKGHGDPHSRRFHQSFKKVHGTMHTYRRGCRQTWVVDCDSVPMRKFFFEDVFAEYAATRAHVFGDFRGIPGSETSSKNNREVIECDMLGLEDRFNLTEDQKVALSDVNTRSGMDYWMYEGRIMGEVKDHVMNVTGESWLHSWFRHVWISDYTMYFTWVFLSIRNQKIDHKIIDLRKMIREYVPAVYESVCLRPDVSESVCTDFRLLLYAKAVLSQAQWKDSLPVLADLYNKLPMPGFHMDYYKCDWHVCSLARWREVMKEFAPLWKGVMCLSNCIQNDVDSWFPEKLPVNRRSGQR